jgi:hypothetical protein
MIYINQKFHEYPLIFPNIILTGNNFVGYYI